MAYSAVKNNSLRLIVRLILLCTVCTTQLLQGMKKSNILKQPKKQPYQPAKLRPVKHKSQNPPEKQDPIYSLRQSLESIVELDGKETTKNTLTTRSGQNARALKNPLRELQRICIEREASALELSLENSDISEDFNFLAFAEDLKNAGHEKLNEAKNSARILDDWREYQLK